MFSVVIPLYNKEESIFNTINSVLNQSFQDFEIIVVNDGSTDKSINVVNDIQDTRIKLINQKNQGVSNARNRGIKEAHFEWIAFLDGDDLWESNHLDEIIKMMKAFPEEKVFVTSFEYSDKRKLFKHKRNNPIFKIENYFKEAVNEILLWTSIVVVNIECLEKVGVFNPILKRGEDVDLWARLSKKYKIIKSIEITAIYRIDAENRTNLSKDLKSTHIYYFDFSGECNRDEFTYYKSILYNQLYSYLRKFYIFCVFKLLFRYKEIKLFDFIIFVFGLVKGKFFHQKINIFYDD